MKKTILTPLVVSAFLLAATTYDAAAASNRTFTGAVSNLWSDAGNWSNSAVPGSDDAPRLSTGKSVVLSYSAPTVGAIYLGGSASYLNNSLSIQDGGSLSCGTIYLSTGSIQAQTSTLIVQNGSTLSAAGIYVTTTGSSNKTGYLTVMGNSVLTSSGNIYVSGMGGTTNSGTLTVQNNATLSCGALYITTNSSNAGLVILQNGATLSAGSVYVTSGSGNTGMLQLQNGATMNSSAIYLASNGSGNTASILIQNNANLNSGTIFVAATGSNQVAALTIGTGSNVVVSGNGISITSGTDALNSAGRVQIEGNAFYQGAINIGSSTSNPSGSSATMTFAGAEFTATSSTNTFRIGQNGTAVLKLGETDFGTIYYSGLNFSEGAQMVIDGSDFTGELNLALITYRNAPSDVSGLTITFINFDESYGELTVADNISWINPTGIPGDANYQEGYLLLHTAIPEPALAGLLVGALALTFAVRRRRSQT